MLELLTQLTLHFPQAGRDKAQLVALAEDWAQDLASYSPAVLHEAVRRIRRQERFFPTTATMIDYAGTVWREQSQRQQALPSTGMAPAAQNRGARLASLLRDRFDPRLSDVQRQAAADEFDGLLAAGRR